MFKDENSCMLHPLTCDAKPGFVGDVLLGLAASIALIVVTTLVIGFVIKAVTAIGRRLR